MAVTFRFVWPGRIDRYATAKPARNIGLAECPQLDRKPNSTARIFYEVSIMNPRYDVFRNLEGNEVRFLGTAATLEEAEQLARSQKLSLAAEFPVLCSFPLSVIRPEWPFRSRRTRRRLCVLAKTIC